MIRLGTGARKRPALTQGILFKSMTFYLQLKRTNCWFHQKAEWKSCAFSSASLKSWHESKYRHAAVDKEHLRRKNKQEKSRKGGREREKGKINVQKTLAKLHSHWTVERNEEQTNYAAHDKRKKEHGNLNCKHGKHLNCPMVLLKTWHSPTLHATSTWWTAVSCNQDLLPWWQNFILSLHLHHERNERRDGLPFTNIVCL